VNSSVISVIPPEDGLYIGMAMVRSLYYSKIKKMFAVPVWDAKYRYLSEAVCTGLYWMILFTAWGKALAVGLAPSVPSYETYMAWFTAWTVTSLAHFGSWISLLVVVTLASL
jgi:hypothetical protein